MRYGRPLAKAALDRADIKYFARCTQLLPEAQLMLERAQALAESAGTAPKYISWLVLL